MGVYIPNMEKPKRCVGCPIDERWCKLWKDFDSWDVETHPDCPLIEIVRCGECKHYEREVCRLDPFWERDTEPTDFCNKGERRAKGEPMSDLISRAAAINALIQEGRNVDSHYLESERIIHESDAVEAISMLPSAQQWIPCSEWLPREYTRVIGYMAWNGMTVIEYQHGRWYSIDHLEPLPDEAVIAWMPLPTPYIERRKVIGE